MSTKNLLRRYISLFLALSLAGVYLLNWYKNQEVESFLTNSLQELEKSYDNAYEQARNVAELTLYNNILYDENVVKIYKEINQNKEKARDDLYKYLKNDFFYLKSFGVKQLNFYLPNSETFLRMKDPEIFGDILDNKETLQYVNSTLKDIDSIELGKNHPSIRFIKPLFDKNLNHLGSIELGFSFDTLASFMEKSSDLNIFFAYNSAQVREKIVSSKQKNFKAFSLNEKYKVETNIYETYKVKDEIFDKFEHEDIKRLRSGMLYSKPVSFCFEYKNSKHPLLMLPLSKSLTSENFIYLVAYGTKKLTSEIFVLKYFTYVLVALIVFTALIVALLALLEFNENKKRLALNKYESLLNAIDKYVVMVETDKNGYITSVTQAFCDICGYRKDELIGENMNLLRHPDVSKKFFEGLWKSLRTTGRWEGEIKNLDKNGNSYWIKGAIFPRYDLDGKMIGFLSIRVNITDAKQLKKINSLLKEDLSNKLYEIKMKDKSLIDNTKVELMGKILDSVAHQWKAPISAISIELANLGARIDNENFNSMNLSLIKEEIEYQLKSLSITLNEFKSFFNDKTQNDKYNVNSTVEDVVGLISKECRLHDIKVDIISKEDIYCFGTHQELKQILVNLLNNSLEQLIFHKIDTPKIAISVVEDEGNVLIKLSDNARGKTDEVMQRVFCENYDANANKDRGLNLYIARLLIEKIGATIWFENIDDTTTQIYLKLVSKDRRKNSRGI